MEEDMRERKRDKGRERKREREERERGDTFCLHFNLFSSLLFLSSYHFPFFSLEPKPLT
jgi:hypothetical protein